MRAVRHLRTLWGGFRRRFRPPRHTAHPRRTCRPCPVRQACSRMLPQLRVPAAPLSGMRAAPTGDRTRIALVSRTLAMRVARLPPARRMRAAPVRTAPVARAVPGPSPRAVRATCCPRCSLCSAWCCWSPRADCSFMRRWDTSRRPTSTRTSTKRRFPIRRARGFPTSTSMR